MRRAEDAALDGRSPAVTPLIFPPTSRQNWEEQTAQLLHDVVGHNLTIIEVQLRVWIDNSAIPDISGLRWISETAVAALTDLRRITYLMRSGTPGECGGPALRDWIAALPERIPTEVARVGVSISDWPDQPLPPDTALLVERVIREGVANAARHSPGARVDLSVEFSASTATLAITSSGTARAAPGTGTGLAELGRALIAAGGALSAGPVNGQTFAIRAELPHR